MRRRHFLQGSTAAGAGLALGLSAGEASAGGFGDFPEGYEGLRLPEGRRAKSVLEIFLYGGLTTWETFYAVEEYGKKDDPKYPNTQLYTFYDPANPGASPTVQAATKCGAAGPLFSAFGVDAAGMQVKLGPFAAPLRARPDVLGRTRVVVTRHRLEPHEAAIPLALCGKTLGAPSMTSLGAHVQRWALDRSEGRKSPFSYVFSGGASFVTDNLRAASATGLHPGSARPLFIKLDQAARLSQLLERGGVDDRAAHDALVGAYADLYRQRLRVAGAPARAPKFEELLQSVASVENADAIRGVLAASLFDPVSSTVCQKTNLNTPRMGLEIARHLLRHPDERAAYCCVIDEGLVLADGGGGYDTHGESPFTQSTNLKNVLDSLLSRVRAPGEAGPDAEAKIDLDETLVVLNMEFGRSPGPQGGLGRNHWPHGYVTVYIGGPVTAAEQGVYGAIGPNGYGTTYVEPSEHRVASLLAMGIWPFGPEGFGTSDVGGASDEGDAARKAMARVLGVSL
ncbi:MAG TPA: DUF1501 domain-containing protein [Polyangiaceae bacterium]|nr:DUF1501 domain-containing protein [Polyangiaceae bacterium]